MAQWKSIGDVPGIIERLSFQGFGCWMQAWLVKRSMVFCQNWVHGITYVGQWCVPIGLKKRLGCQKSALLVCFHAPIFGGLPSVVPATFLDDGWVGCADFPWNGRLATRPSRREETQLFEAAEPQVPRFSLENRRSRPWSGSPHSPPIHHPKP